MKFFRKRPSFLSRKSSSLPLPPQAAPITNSILRKDKKASLGSPDATGHDRRVSFASLRNFSIRFIGASVRDVNQDEIIEHEVHDEAGGGHVIDEVNKIEHQKTDEVDGR